MTRPARPVFSFEDRDSRSQRVSPRGWTLTNWPAMALKVGQPMTKRERLLWAPTAASRRRCFSNPRGLGARLVRPRKASD